MEKSILGYAVQTGSMSECVQEIQEALSLKEPNCRWLACLNPHSYAVARDDLDFANALKSADWIIPDGIGVVIASRILGGSIAERITGFDIFEGVMQALDRCEGRVFFLGSTEETLALVVEHMSRDYPKITLAGTYSPPFKAEFETDDIAEMLAAINGTRTDVLWVGMTAPKQEKWIAQNREQLPVIFAGAIGAVFDFYSGRVGRSHLLFRKVGLEWLPRLVQQPGRLWRRTIISAPIFIWDVIRLRLTRT